VTAPADYVTIAYDPRTGAQLWASHYDGPDQMFSPVIRPHANAVTVSPDGSRVFVTGQTLSARGHRDYATVGYDASTGTQLWARLHAGSITHGTRSADAQAMVISPDGKVVYVTGYSGSSGDGGVYDYVTIAYDAATGKTVWTARYDNGGNDQGHAIAISPSGRVVYVTGRSFASKTGYDDATIAYNAATGKKLWAPRYNGPANGNEYGEAITVSPDGKSVYITGGSHGSTTGRDFATIRYRAATGRQLWVRRYNGPGNLDDSPTGLAVTPDNATVVVTGASPGTGGQNDLKWATIAYNANTGAARWTKRFGLGSAVDIPAAVVVNPRGGTVYVTGGVGENTAGSSYGTVAYSVSTGAMKWAKTYSTSPFDYATALAVSPDGHTLYVTGQSDSHLTTDIATIAYRA
jgi:WD40 repeat protein